MSNRTGATARSGKTGEGGGSEREKGFLLGFLGTLPGLITAVAALITAIGGAFFGGTQLGGHARAQPTVYVTVTPHTGAAPGSASSAASQASRQPSPAVPRLPPAIRLRSAARTCHRLPRSRNRSRTTRPTAPSGSAPPPILTLSALAVAGHRILSLAITPLSMTSPVTKRLTRRSAFPTTPTTRPATARPLSSTRTAARPSSVSRSPSRLTAPSGSAWTCRAPRNWRSTASRPVPTTLTILATISTSPSATRHSVPPDR